MLLVASAASVPGYFLFRIDLKHLCWAAENLVAGNVVNEIKVDAHTRKWATVALERMLTIKGSPTE